MCDISGVARWDDRDDCGEMIDIDGWPTAFVTVAIGTGWPTLPA
jgi:hypothetical protein